LSPVEKWLKIFDFNVHKIPFLSKSIYYNVKKGKIIRNGKFHERSISSKKTLTE